VSPSRQLSDSERLDWLRLSQTENVGPVTFQQLISAYKTASAAIEALPELSNRGGRRKPLKLYPVEAAEQDIARAKNIGARFVAIGELGYPPDLAHVPSPPPMLCVSGKIELAETTSVAIVGARNASASGMKFARQLAHGLCEAGLLVVSGLARGIDTAAHEASVNAKTAAVLAGGLDHYYPPENEKLQRAIAERGLLISEMMPGTAPKAEHFPRRNRIISGMAKAVIIVEAAMRSGSLITARFAAEQGREVFAVPGSPLDPRCEGTNKLIKDGANILTAIDDVLEALKTPRYVQNSQLFETEAVSPTLHSSIGNSEREHVARLLSPSPIETDDLIRESGLPAAQIITILLELELAGRAIRHAGGRISAGL
jgi:DNA processing protein